MDKGFFTFCFRKGYERSRAFTQIFDKPEVLETMGVEKPKGFNVRLLTAVCDRIDGAEKYIIFRVSSENILEFISGPYDGQDFHSTFPDPITEENYGWYADYVYEPIAQLIEKLEYTVRGIRVLGDDDLMTEKDYEFEKNRPGDEEPVWFPFLVDEEDRIVCIEHDNKTTREEAEHRAEELLENYLKENPDSKYGCGVTYTDITENGKYMLI